MPNRPATFLESDVTRAIKGASKAGLPVERVEIDRNGIIAILKLIGKDFPPNAEIVKSNIAVSAE